MYPLIPFSDLPPGLLVLQIKILVGKYFVVHMGQLAWLSGSSGLLLVEAHGNLRRALRYSLIRPLLTVYRDHPVTYSENKVTVITLAWRDVTVAWTWLFYRYITVSFTVTVIITMTITITVTDTMTMIMT